MSRFTTFKDWLFVLVFSCILQALQASCPPGWLTWQDSCYILLPNKMSFPNASFVCNRSGVGLFVPNSEEESFYVWELLKTWMAEFEAESSQNLWIGCSIESGGSIVCPDQVDTLFQKWKPGEPSKETGEDCIRMIEKNGGKLADIICDIDYSVACEMQAVSYKCRRSSPRYIHVPQQCLLKYQIKSYPVKESIGCGLACWAEPLCHSFNLWKQADNKKICQLNYASRAEADVTEIKYEENCYFYEP